jgi:hypothetical protein
LSITGSGTREGDGDVFGRAAEATERDVQLPIVSTLPGILFINAEGRVRSVGPFLKSNQPVVALRITKFPGGEAAPRSTTSWRRNRWWPEEAAAVTACPCKIKRAAFSRALCIVFRQCPPRRLVRHSPASAGRRRKDIRRAQSSRLAKAGAEEL